MFEPRGAFAMGDEARVARFVATWERSGFRPWRDGVVGDEPATSDEAVADGASDQHVAAHAFAEGLVDGEAMAREAAAAAAMAAAERIAAAADRFQPCCETTLAALLAEAVARLLSEMFEIDAAQSDHLERRALQLAKLVCGEIEPVRVRLHPDDYAALADAQLPWPASVDATLERGEIRLETQEGGIADSPAERIERLRRRIAGEVTR